MLQFMRQRASSWMIKAILGIIVLTFVFVGFNRYNERNDVAAATVNGEEISSVQFQDRYALLLEQARRQFGNQLNDELLGMMKLKERALDQLITETILLQKATELGFQVSDQELSSSIRQISFFQKNGRFNKALYSRILQSNRMTPEMFEQQQKRDLLGQKVRQLIADGAKVSDDEARLWYDWQNAEIKINVAVFKADDFSEIKPSEDALKEYFDEHKEEYKTGEKTQVTYLRFAPETFIPQVKVDDEEIQQYYDEHQEDFSTEKTVEASHILIQVYEKAPEALAAAKKAEAQKIYDMVTSGQDFAAVAKEYSEDETSAPKGGALPPFKKQDLVAAFADKAFSMEPGEISEPVRTKFGWHIIKVNKVNDATVKPLAEVKPEIEKTLALKKARELAYEAALHAFDLALDANSVKDAAQQLDMEAQTTPFFTRNDKLEGVPKSQVFISQSFDLLEGDISDVLEADGFYYLLQVDKRKAPEVPALEAVREKVSDDLIAQLKEKKAKEEAEAFLKMLEDGASIDEAAQERHVKLMTTGYFQRQGEIPQVGNEPEVSREAFLLSPENRVPDNVIEGTNGYYVIYLVDRRQPEEDNFVKDKDKIKAQLLQLKKEDAFSAWLSARKAESEITRDERFLK